MKKLVSAFVMAVLAMVVVQVGAAQNSSGAGMGSDDKTVAAITKMERDWEKAMNNKDDAAVSKIMADGWVGLNPDGSTEEKSQFISEVKKGDYQNVKLETVNVKSFGSTAVATGKASDPKMGNVVYMDVFMRQGGAWKAFASSVGPIQAAH
jgi:ketosteroid isomerase-like protein